MPEFRLPWSGDVTQLFKLWASLFTSVGSQFGLINISLGKSSKPQVEADVLSEVASYGKQLGRFGDALGVLVAHFNPRGGLTPAEEKAIHDLKRLLEDIAEVKERHDVKPAGAP